MSYDCWTRSLGNSNSSSNIPLPIASVLFLHNMLHPDTECEDAVAASDARPLKVETSSQATRQTPRSSL